MALSESQLFCGIDMLEMVEYRSKLSEAQKLVISQLVKLNTRATSVMVDICAFFNNAQSRGDDYLYSEKHSGLIYEYIKHAWSGEVLMLDFYKHVAMLVESGILVDNSMILSDADITIRVLGQLLSLLIEESEECASAVFSHIYVAVQAIIAKPVELVKPVKAVKAVKPVEPVEPSAVHVSRISSTLERLLTPPTRRSGSATIRATLTRLKDERFGFAYRTESGLEGARITQITPGGLVHMEGSLRVGDIIVAINDQCIISMMYEEIVNLIENQLLLDIEAVKPE